MNKINIFEKIGAVGFFVATLSLMLVGVIYAATFNPINSQLSVGSSGGNVTNLQTFFASNHDIYPEGRITGYYGGLTRAAVVQFQVSYDIPQVGAVGPMTLARINSVIAKGYGIDIYAPGIYNVSVQKTTNNATVAWATSESAGGKVFYSTSPFLIMEAVGNFTEPSIIGGNSMPALNSQSSQSITLQNLNSNTVYYYIVEAQDASGNVSVTNQSTFTTN